MPTPLHAPPDAPPLRGLVSGVVHLLVPACCPGCGGRLAPARPPFGLCARCRGRLVLAAPRGAACRCCGGPIPEPPRPGWDRSAPGARRVRPRARPPLCDGCRRRPPAFERLVAPWSYRPPLSEVVKALKFGRLPHLGDRLAEPLAEALGTALTAGIGTGIASASPHGPVVVAVPLHWRRRLARGYDQAERIARPLALRLGAPFAAALVRVRHTPPQTALDRAARRGNVRRAFRVRRASAGRIAGRRVLLVDDVTTTGATLDAAARALLSAGARSVVAAAVSRTPNDGPGGGPRPRRFPWPDRAGAV